MARIAARSTGFRIAYGHVVATDSAVISLAEPVEPVNRIRGMIRERLRLPPETRNEADLVHTTLFRYRGPLSDPEKFLSALEDTSAEATAEVGELIVSKVTVYPSLEAEVLARLPLAHRQAHRGSPTRVLDAGLPPTPPHASMSPFCPDLLCVPRYLLVVNCVSHD